MKLHKIQFNEILKQIKDIQVYSNSEYITFDYYNGYISLSFSFCVSFRLYDSKGLHIDGEEQRITDDQMNAIHKEVMFKCEQIGLLKQEDREDIKRGEVGF